jgi:AraC-like DNA-binding protein
LTTPLQQPADTTILAAVIADVIDAAELLGVPRAEILAAAGLSEETLADVDARISMSAHIAAWVAVSKYPIGLALGEHLGLTSMGAVGYAMQHERSVGDALDWYHRYRAVLHPQLIADTSVRDTPAGRRLVFSKPMAVAFTSLREPLFAYASAIRSLLRGLTGEAIDARSVTYPCARGADASTHEEFYRCPVAWGGAVFEISFDASVLDKPLPRRDARLFSYLAQQAERLMATLPVNDTLSDAVRREIASTLADGEPNQQAIAKKMAMTPRTMQRRLASDGVTFASIVESVRRERAELLLSDRKLTASEVGFLLGFSEPAAFFRAFKRWTGDTPQGWRAARRA